MGPQEIKVFRSGQYTANIVKHWERKTVISDKDTYSYFVAALDVVAERAALAASSTSPAIAPGKCSPSSPATHLVAATSSPGPVSVDFSTSSLTSKPVQLKAAATVTAAQTELDLPAPTATASSPRVAAPAAASPAVLALSDPCHAAAEHKLDAILTCRDLTGGLSAMTADTTCALKETTLKVS